MNASRFAPALVAMPFLVFAACACPGEREPPATPAAPKPSVAAPVASAAVDAGPPAPKVLLPSFGYPPSRRDAVTEVIHGQEVSDPYRWLEDAKTDEVKTWMVAQNDFARSKLDALPGRDAIAQRLKELYYIEAMGTPHHYGTRYFYARR